MWTIFKVFIEFIKVLFQFYVLVVWLQGHVGSEFPDWGSNLYPLH